MRVLVLCGGASSERIVSMASGDAVAKWVASLGHDVLKYDPECPDVLFGPERIMAPQAIGMDAPPLQPNAHFNPRVVRGLLDVLERERIDLVFPILHGGYGEDGSLQSALELVGMPYTGSGPRSCANAMHKATAKILMQAAGVPVAAGFVVEESELVNTSDIAIQIETAYGFPAVVKPLSGGSTIGLTIVNSADDLPEALQKIRDQKDRALVERYFKGREIAATVIDGIPFPLIEIRPKAGFYDYANKYTAGRTEYIVPAELPESVTKSIQETAATVFRALDSRGFARIDFLVNGRDYVCLELNSLPGMTATSLVPKAARAYGWTAEELIARVIDRAWSPSEFVRV